jgi:hypothetical protein
MRLPRRPPIRLPAIMRCCCSGLSAWRFGLRRAAAESRRWGVAGDGGGDAVDQGEDEGGVAVGLVGRASVTVAASASHSGRWPSMMRPWMWSGRWSNSAISRAAAPSRGWAANCIWASNRWPTWTRLWLASHPTTTRRLTAGCAHRAREQTVWTDSARSSSSPRPLGIDGDAPLATVGPSECKRWSPPAGPEGWRG